MHRFWQSSSCTLARRTQDAPLRDLSGAIGTVPVPFDPAGKVFTYLFSSVVQLKQNNFIGL